MEAAECGRVDPGDSGQMEPGDLGRVEAFDCERREPADCGRVDPGDGGRVELDDGVQPLDNKKHVSPAPRDCPDICWWKEAGPSLLSGTLSNALGERSLRVASSTDEHGNKGCCCWTSSLLYGRIAGALDGLWGLAEFWPTISV